MCPQRARGSFKGKVPEMRCLRGIAAVATTIMLLAGASAAQADLREASAADPTGDGTPLDITNVSARYDSNGSATVILDFKQSIASVPPFFFYVRFASFSPPQGCSGLTLTLSGFSDIEDAFWRISSAEKGDGYLFILDDHTASISTNDAGIRGLSLDCLEVSVTAKDGDGSAWDEFNGPFDTNLFFDGFGPPRCAGLAIKGKTLAQARKTITGTSGCKVGRISGPTKAPKARKGKRAKKVIVSKAQVNSYDPAKVDITTRLK